jgi:cytoskeletal protein CcmA (bactofilin family)
MMRKLLGKAMAKPQSKPQRPKPRSEPSAKPPETAQAAERSELTLSERLALHSERSDSTSWPAGESSSFTRSAETPVQPSVQPPVRPPVQPPVQPQKPTAQPAARQPARSEISRHSLVGKSMVIIGDLQAAEDLTIAGRLEGTLTHTADLLTVAKTGVVKANIQTRSLIVEGRVEGDIECRDSVALTDSAHVTGTIQAARISIADGAQFNGKIVTVEAKAG